MADYKSWRKAQNHLLVDDGKLAYIDQGEGDPIMLVHGVPTSSWLYRKIIPGLVAKGYRVIAPDLLGYGSSDKPDGEPSIYDPRAQGKRLAQLVEHLNLENWTHVCHDGGGVWTWEMMKLNAKMGRLVILNTILFTEGFKPPMQFKRGHFLGKMYAGLYKSSGFCKLMIKSTFNNGMDKCKLTRSELRGYYKPMSEGTANALYAFFTSLGWIIEQLPEYQALLKKAAIPTKVIWGKDDNILIGEKQAPRIKELLGLSEQDIHLLEGKKHFIQEEAPDEIINIIANFK